MEGRGNGSLVHPVLCWPPQVHKVRMDASTAEVYNVLQQSSKRVFAGAPARDGRWAVGCGLWACGLVGLWGVVSVGLGPAPSPMTSRCQPLLSLCGVFLL